ncbi:MAG: stalk domain-containing protein [Tissierellia bacterium]|nr:stalk domain-containing protein [Tissierellia bacterium]
MKQRKFSFLLAMILLLSMIPVFSVEAAAPNLVYQEPIGAGATRYKYEWQLKKGKVLINVIKCDLNNPNLEIGLVTGGGKYTQKATVSQMANRTGAVGLVNGDFFNMKAQGAPLGASVSEGRLLSAPMNSIGYYTLGIEQSGRAVIDMVTFGGHVHAANGKKYPIQGLNKAEYWDNITGAHSHTHTINLYNDHWASKSRGKAGKNAVEVLVNANGKVEEISKGRTLGYAVPKGKIILQANDRGKDFIRQNIKVGDTIKLDYKLYPEKNWKMLIGGHGLLVDKGVKIPYALAPQSIAGNRGRTAAGISQDGKTLWIAAAEKSNRSKGLQLSELSEFMVSLGCYRALNFDGGGSTAMAVASTGELKPEIKTKPEAGRERYVVNGLGVYNKAEEGPLHEMKIKGPSTMLIGETASFTVLGWDANYVAKDMTKIPVNYSDDKEGINEWNGNQKTTVHGGSIKVLAESNGVKATKDVKIEGAKSIKSLEITVDKRNPSPGEVVTLKAKATTKSGRKVDISPKAMKYTLEGFQGESLTGTGQVRIHSVEGVATGKIKGDLGGFTTTLSLVNPNAKNVHMSIGKENYSVNGEQRKMDTVPIIIKDRTMVPLRFLVEAFGGEVTWNQETRTAIVEYRGIRIELPVGSDTIHINGIDQKIDSPATIKNDRTLVPIRFVSEGLGMIVEYGEKDKVVDIYELPLEKTSEAKKAPVEVKVEPENVNIQESSPEENQSSQS